MRDKRQLRKLKDLARLQLMVIINKLKWEFIQGEGSKSGIFAFSNNGGQENYIKPVQLFVKNDIRQAVIFIHRGKNYGFDYLLDTCTGKIHIHQISKDEKPLGYLGFLNMRSFINKLMVLDGHYGILPTVDKYFYADNFYSKYPDNVVEWVSLELFKSSRYNPVCQEVKESNLFIINHMFDTMLTEHFYNGLNETEKDRLSHRYSIENKKQLDLMEFIRPN